MKVLTVLGELQLEELVNVMVRVAWGVSQVLLWASDGQWVWWMGYQELVT